MFESTFSFLRSSNNLFLNPSEGLAPHFLNNQIPIIATTTTAVITPKVIPIFCPPSSCAGGLPVCVGVGVGLGKNVLLGVLVAEEITDVEDDGGGEGDRVAVGGEGDTVAVGGKIEREADMK
jgi:hypothetical protein